MTLPDNLAAKGWVIRPAEPNSDAILVRGARRAGDGYCETRNGFVYAETAEEARKYDAAHGY